MQKLQSQTLKVLALVVFCVAGWMLMIYIDSPSPDEQLRDLRRHFARREYEDVVVLAEALKHSGDLTDRVILMAA